MNHERFHSNQTYLIVCLVLSLLLCSTVVAQEGKGSESNEVVVKQVKPDWWETWDYKNTYPTIRDIYQDHYEPEYGKEGVNPNPRYEEDREKGSDGWPDGFDKPRDDAKRNNVELRSVYGENGIYYVIELSNNGEISMRLKNYHFKNYVKHVALRIVFDTAFIMTELDPDGGCVIPVGTFEVEFTPADIKDPTKLDVDNTVTHKLFDKEKIYYDSEMTDFNILERYVSFTWAEQPHWEKITIRLRDSGQFSKVRISSFDVRTRCRKTKSHPLDYYGLPSASGTGSISYIPGANILSFNNFGINSVNYLDPNPPDPTDTNDPIQEADVWITNMNLVGSDSDAVLFTDGELEIKDDSGTQLQASLPYTYVEGSTIYGELVGICYDTNTPSLFLQGCMYGYQHNQSRLLLKMMTEQNVYEAIQRGNFFTTGVDFTLGMDYLRTCDLPEDGIEALTSAGDTVTWSLIQWHKLHTMEIGDHNSPEEPVHATIEFATDPNKWIYLKDLVIPKPTGIEDDNTPTVIDLEGIEAQYLRLRFSTDGGDIPLPYDFSKVNFTYWQTKATSPIPSNGYTLAIDRMSPTIVVSWTPGVGACYSSCNILDPQGVTDNIEGVEGNVIEIPCSVPGTYSWQVNGYNEFGDVYEGDIWSFNVYLTGEETPAVDNQDESPYIVTCTVLDDFEDYNDVEGKGIRRNWRDGIGHEDINGVHIEGNDTGAIISYLGSSSHSGQQCMEFDYKIGAELFSEADFYGRDGLDSIDWGEPDVLSFWVFGDTNNAQYDMYVKILDSEGEQCTVEPNKPADLQQSKWQQMIFGLTEIAEQGVDLNNVYSLTIGIGNLNQPQPEGEGVVRIDDICLLAEPDDDIDPNDEGEEPMDSDGDGEPDETDCAPNNPNIYPGADEICNGDDDNCDGVVPYYETDDDGDGLSECEGDCFDDDPLAGIDLCEPNQKPSQAYYVDLPLFNEMAYYISPWDQDWFGTTVEAGWTVMLFVYPYPSEGVYAAITDENGVPLVVATEDFGTLSAEYTNDTGSAATVLLNLKKLSGEDVVEYWLEWF